MANIDLVGQIPVEINHQQVITATRLSAKRTRTVTVKKGAQGPIGAAKGVFNISASLTLAVPKPGMEYDSQLLDLLAGGFTMSFPRSVVPFGVEKWVIVGCVIADEETTNDPGEGNAEVTWQITAT